MTQNTADPVENLGELSGYRATRELIATRYRQSNRTVFDVALPLHLIPSHLPKPDPEVPFEGNRRVDRNHARKFAIYWRENPEWTTPPILLDTNAELGFRALYEAAGVEVGVLELPHNSAATLDILDGQHRILGWWYAIEGIANELKDAREQLQQSKRAEDEVGVQVWRDKVDALVALENRLKQEYVTVELVEGITLQEHKQAFADITNNAKGITKSKTVEFDSVSVLNRVTRELAETHPLLAGRVDFERDRVTGGNEAVMSATNVADIVRHVALGIAGRMNARREKAFRDDHILALASSYLDLLVEAFPDLAEVADGELSPVDLRKRSLLGSPTILRVLAGTFHNVAIELVEDVPQMDPDGWMEAKVFFEKLAPHMAAPVTPGSAWHRTGFFPDEPSMAPSSRAQDLKGLTDLLTKWESGEKPIPF